MQKNHGQVVQTLWSKGWSDDCMQVYIQIDGWKRCSNTYALQSREGGHLWRINRLPSKQVILVFYLILLFIDTILKASHIFRWVSLPENAGFTTILASAILPNAQILQLSEYLRLQVQEIKVYKFKVERKWVLLQYKRGLAILEPNFSTEVAKRSLKLYLTYWR